ncbi:M23 family metallopeptidase [Novosphingobium album (ex Hu et al. 2023)]|uniref:M23 family metallopeptidase n=1 Tax=Novosphingobium album (ex Hu et al. 2023) TaxID=2930093 RepID=A0ABT0B1B6_9SPHN|nr:M23 family metallopeptidase [Novosphingobium album (ex Hu et al. 2023)]MCJ2178719.1 M23 family metallopeptidase [Novosphingobium album (ex Hu et al. 2023)]
MLYLNCLPVSARDLPDQKSAEGRHLIEPATGRDAGTPEHPHAETQLAVYRETGSTRLEVDTGLAAIGMSIGGARGVATLTPARMLEGATVVASRTTDFVGQPLDIFRPIGSGVAGPGNLPSRLPVNARVSSGFGYRIHPTLGGWRAHAGVDLAAAYGSPVVATTGGVVDEADWRGGYGLFVGVRNNGVQTRFGHLSRLNVVPGQRVKPGDVIGYVGSTGRSTGPHLHYEVRVNGQAVDPLRTKAK